MRIFTTIILVMLLTAVSYGQSSTARNQGPVLLINTSYAYQVPAGDLVDRFGNNFNIGGGVDFMMRNNFILGTQVNYLFGNEVKTNLVQDLTRPLANGEQVVYGNGGVGEPSDFQIKERGFYAGGHIGKLFNIGQDNPRSGVRVTVGAGYLRHKIRVQDDPQSFAPILAGDYKQGWDKLTSGLAFTQFVGYQMMSKNRRINFSFGLELTQGFTKNQRDYDFQTRSETSKETRNDHLIGLRFNWSLPLFFEGKAEEVFY
jgi:acetyltransferase-like isoleucine patch superfamily enzyme